MSQIQASAADSPSRLFASALEAGLIEVGRAEGDIAEKLARLIDLSDSITLAEALRSLARRPPAVALRSDSQTEPRQCFIAGRGEMLTFIANSFVCGAASVPFLLPRGDRDSLADTQSGYSPYQRFYQLHQSEMERQVAGLRKTFRELLSCRSPRLAHLASLDQKLAEPLAEHSRRLLAGLPRALGKRFASLRDSHVQRCGDADPGAPETWMQAGGWLQQFSQDMQNLLLAELDFRLLPVMGLLEALEEEESVSL